MVPHACIVFSPVTSRLNVPLWVVTPLPDTVHVKSPWWLALITPILSLLLDTTSLPVQVLPLQVQLQAGVAVGSTPTTLHTSRMLSPCSTEVTGG